MFHTLLIGGVPQAASLLYRRLLVGEGNYGSTANSQVGNLRYSRQGCLRYRAVDVSLAFW